MEWIFDNDRPIYIQLVEKLKMYIISGAYKPGEKLPSVRDFAMDKKVNPNTMQKALIELESYGLVYTQRTSGRYVTEDKELISKIKSEMVDINMKEFLHQMELLGFSSRDVVEYINNKERNE